MLNNKRERAKDTGLAIILILLLVAYLGDKQQFIFPAIVLLVIVMTCPSIFNPLATVWFKFSHILGTVVSTLILFIVFIIVLTPVAIVRRILGKDSLMLKKWKLGQDSVLTVRDHKFTAEDLEKPY